MTSTVMTQHRTLNRAAVVAASLLAASTAGLSSLLRTADVQAQLQTRFLPAALPQDRPVAGIVALGGDSRRIVEAVQIARQLPDAKLVITGALPDDYAHALSQGFSSDRLVLERRATTTFENAAFSRKLVTPQSNEQWILVTSASHMPRAMGTFRKAGFKPLPWPIPDQAADENRKQQIVRHEVVGLIGYWVLGRSDELYPTPSDKPVKS